MSVFGLDRGHKPSAVEGSEVVRDGAVPLAHERLATRRHRVAVEDAEHGVDRPEERALAIGARPVEKEQTLLPRIPGQRVTDCQLQESDEVLIPSCEAT